MKYLAFDNMELINLTPHKINIYNEDQELVMVIEPSGMIAKIVVTRELVGTEQNIPFYRTTIGDPEGLPSPQYDTIFIVSGMFRANCPRFDLYQPGELLRNEEGLPIGCIGLSQ